MYACELMPHGHTDPFKVGFQKAWGQLPDCYPAAREIPKCGECRYAPFCETCPAIRMAETGSYFGKPAYFCREAETVYHMLKDLHAIN